MPKTGIKRYGQSRESPVFISSLRMICDPYLEKKTFKPRCELKSSKHRKLKDG